MWKLKECYLHICPMGYYQPYLEAEKMIPFTKARSTQRKTLWNWLGGTSRIKFSLMVNSTTLLTRIYYLWGIFNVVLRVEQILISSEKVVILLWCSVLSCFRPFKELIFCIIVVLKVYLAILELCFCCTDLFFFFLTWCLDLLLSLTWCVALYMCNFVFLLFNVFYCISLIVYDSWVINQLIHWKSESKLYGI